MKHLWQEHPGKYQYQHDNGCGFEVDYPKLTQFFPKECHSREKMHRENPQQIQVIGSGLVTGGYPKEK